MTLNDWNLFKLRLKIIYKIYLKLQKFGHVYLEFLIQCRLKERISKIGLNSIQHGLVKTPNSKYLSFLIQSYLICEKYFFHFKIFFMIISANLIRIKNVD